MKNCKNEMKVTFLRGTVPLERNAAARKIHKKGDGYPKKPCAWHISCAIFTKYMIHRFIKHGKRFVTFFSEKYSFLRRKMDLQEIMQVILQFRVE